MRTVKSSTKASRNTDSFYRTVFFRLLFFTSFLFVDFVFNASNGEFGVASEKTLGASIDASQSESGLTYTCGVNSASQGISHQSLWLVYNSSQELEQSIPSPNLSSARINPLLTYVCQVIVDDGTLYSLHETTLPKSLNSLNVISEPATDLNLHHSPSVLTERVIAGEKHYVCSSESGDVFPEQTKWLTSNGNALQSNHSSVLAAIEVPVGELQCKLSLLKWSEPLSVEFTPFQLLPASIAVGKGMKNKVLSLKLKPNLKELKLNCRSSSPSVHCHFLQQTARKGALLFINFHETPEEEVFLTLEASTTSESAQKSIRIRTAFSETRTQKKTTRPFVDYHPSISALTCKLNKQTSESESQSTSKVIWLDANNEEIQSSHSPLLLLDLIDPLDQKYSSVRCLKHSTVSQTVEAAISPAFSLNSLLEVSRAQDWFFWDREHLELEVQVKLKRRLKSSKRPTFRCNAQASNDLVFQQNLCKEKSKLLSSAGSSSTHSLKLKFSRQLIETLQEEFSDRTPSDRFAPTKLKVLFYLTSHSMQNQQPSEFEVTLLNWNLSPKVEKFVHHKQAGVTRCQISLSDPNQDHLTGQIENKSEKEQKLFRLDSQHPSTSFAFSWLEKDELSASSATASQPLRDEASLLSPCSATVSDGVLVTEKSSTVSFDELEESDDSQTATQTSSNHSLESESLEKENAKLELFSPIQSHLNQFSTLMVTSFGEQLIPTPVGFEFNRVLFCIAEFGSCPAHFIKDNKLFVLKSASTPHGLTFIGLASKSGTEMLLTIDIVNDGHKENVSLEAQKKQQAPKMGRIRVKAANAAKISLGSKSKQISVHLILQQILNGLPDFHLLPNFSIETAFLCEQGELKNACSFSNELKRLDTDLLFSRSSSLKLTALVRDNSGQRYEISVPIEVNPTQSMANPPVTSQLFFSSQNSSSSLTCELSETHQKNEDSPYIFQLLELGAVVNEQRTFSKQSSFLPPSEKGKDEAAAIDTCIVKQDGRFVSRSILSPTLNSDLSCFVSTTSGWRSSVPCRYTGQSRTERLSFANIEVDLSPVNEPVSFFEAYWEGIGGAKEKGFVHKYTQSPPSAQTSNTPRNSENTELKDARMEDISDIHFVEGFDEVARIIKSNKKISLQSVSKPVEMQLKCHTQAKLFEECDVLLNMIESEAQTGSLKNANEMEISRQKPTRTQIDSPFVIIEVSFIATTQNRNDDSIDEQKSLFSQVFAYPKQN